MDIKVSNGLLQIVGKNVFLKNVTAKVFYPGTSYNILSQCPHGQWNVTYCDGAYVCSCDNFTITVKEDNDALLLKTSYRNDTNADLPAVCSFDALCCEWDCNIKSAFCNEAKSSGGSPFAEMGSASFKRSLTDGEMVESADFTAFCDSNGQNAVFGFCSFKQFFSTVNVCAEGYLVASALTESRTLAPNESIETDWIFIHKTKSNMDCAMDVYTQKVASLMDVKGVKEPLNGFCTWYYYGPNISQKSVLRDLDEVASHKEIPYKLFQIDDGWFKRRGDFYENDKFQSMADIAKAIKSKGLIPGIWVDPHIADVESEVYKEHPDWFVRTFDGTTIHPSHVLDFSNPQAEEWLYNLFVKLTKQWGYEYIKVDLIAPALCVGKYHDPSFNSLKNYRKSFEIIRRAVGEDVYILSCSSPLMAAVGLADSVRSSVDIFERYSSLLDVFSRSLNRTYLCKNLIVNDADCLLLRNAQNEDDQCFRNCVRTEREIETYVTAMLATGSPIIHSDKTELLADEHFKLLSSMFPLLGRPAKCVNFMDESIPCTLDFGKCGNFDIVAFINWSEKATKTFVLRKSGYVFEYWRKEFYGYSNGSMVVEVPAHQVKLFTIADGEGIVPIGVDDTILPQLNWSNVNGQLKITPLKDNEGIYVYSAHPISTDFDCKKVCESVYLVTGEKSSQKIIIK